MELRKAKNSQVETKNETKEDENSLQDDCAPALHRKESEKASKKESKLTCSWALVTLVVGIVAVLLWWPSVTQTSLSKSGGVVFEEISSSYTVSSTTEFPGVQELNPNSSSDRENITETNGGPDSTVLQGAKEENKEDGGETLGDSNEIEQPGASDTKQSGEVKFSREQNITNSFLGKLNKYRFPSKSSEDLSLFPGDLTLMDRLQNGELTKVEEVTLRGKRLVILGDSVDAYIVGEIMTCHRKFGLFRSGFGYPHQKGIQCTFQTNNKREVRMDMMMQGIFEKYDFEIVLHRAFYGIEPLFEYPELTHKSYKKGSTLFEAKSLADQYKALLETSFEKLPEKHRADLLLFNMNLWIAQRDSGRDEHYTDPEIVDGISTYIEVAKGFFHPKAMAYHTIPDVRNSLARKVQVLNSQIRELARKKNIGLFDWQKMASEIPSQKRLRDDTHPSAQLTRNLGTLILTWCFEVLGTKN